MTKDNFFHREAERGKAPEKIPRNTSEKKRLEVHTGGRDLEKQKQTALIVEH